MSRSMKEIVLMLELSASNEWIDAFYLPFDLISGFKPIMTSGTQALTCLMNIRISIDEQCFEKLEESLVRVERLKRDFVQAKEVDKLAELVLDESRDWTKIKRRYSELAQAWKGLMPPTRLGKVVEMCRRDSLASSSLLTPKKYRIVRQLADDFSQRTAIVIMRQLSRDYQAELSEMKLKEKATKKTTKCQKKLNFNLPVSTSTSTPNKNTRKSSEETWNKEITQFLNN